MRAWFHSHRLRFQRSDSTSQKHQFGSTESPFRRRLSKVPKIETFTKIERPAMDSRTSIERYLSAPLSDEAASAPAIDAAIRRQVPLGWMADAAPLLHSRDTSEDYQSDRKPTFFTTASVPDTVDTSYSANSRSRFYHAMDNTDGISLSEARWLEMDQAEVASLRRPATSGTTGPVLKAREWRERVEMYLPPPSVESGTVERAGMDKEIQEIQEKAKELEFMMQQFMAVRKAQNNNSPHVSQEAARARISANPKLAWILGDEAVDTAGIVRPKPIHRAITDIPAGSRSMESSPKMSHFRSPRVNKSSGALNHEYQARQRKPDHLVERLAPKGPSFYCTFCQKGFHDRSEWLSHEQTVHMPEELWVCCPRTGDFPSRCPFCEKGHPSPSHLADHNYLSCQQKPLSERTFHRKDQFLQHISQVHRVSPEQKAARLTELENAWRQPLPLEIGHRALHCGFCGENFATYQERADHVAHHFAGGLDMMCWWKDRISHEKHHPESRRSSNPKLPHECVYCERTFKSLAAAQELHPSCIMWSCSFLPSLQFTMFPDKSRARREVVCCYCNDPLARSPEGKINGATLKDHMSRHNFRACNQTLYFSGQSFRQHLQDSHKLSLDGTLFAGWTLLLKSCRKMLPSVFEQVDKQASDRHPKSDTESSSEKKKSKKTKDQDSLEMRSPYSTNTAPMSFMDLSDVPQRPEPPNKLRRKQSAMNTPRQSGEAPRPSLTQLRSPTFTVPSDDTGPPKSEPDKYPAYPSSSGVPTCPSFFRKRFDASSRNRLYFGVVPDDDKENDEGQRMLRKLQGGVFGGLILHSSLIASVPALMTNSVDVYPVQDE
ncbi:hypothetical protein HBH56_168480 [Parastagonospora nodorum]|uniref:C2H2-type domain-containing protein n=2 Tax=Phaeosphaeria nodorum (strain SN15 / ATCC MYA-4574 / FGSC 10173) TaxID=321614 RepID=A0A7U2I452_PHANO|nr:hypothetical protein HBH56_168480 [Parastagonospora nodorum]QRC98697.1 hypothetical protein JI435_047390 [Parastagonospora nodorum SN15]KAH3936719.1 hypothetical protein HBH54_031570 [Parastagonospora nodorum]KAH4144749.1 hypothetical protein HBH45_022060 [Parastagonospora nodorum]KAH4175472.1 hypothetical protein HBH44_011070 [Parastagonospora nodorum]